MNKKAPYYKIFKHNSVNNMIYIKLKCHECDSTATILILK